ncbi:hypothetical protein O5O45_07700 [Hahella aquimaris]|uniref:hypothetical protein n=1 Tax=Hahella sp. HNIBRBA332 TaxID=3015983 RepID=UPI00273AFDE0|nr:hypothetical protein [Hahella sp. HNIBRBA332]WLQ15795.1 hypothetical protein O5O45_07700 [Hahella sp. HNIBRBA332]
MKKTIKKSSWDAVIDTDICDAYNNADLTIQLRLGFKQINPSGGAATGTYNDYGDKSATARKIVKWSSSEWLSWKANFVSSAKNFWHGKFWLVNNFSEFEYVDAGIKYLPNIWCRLELYGDDYSPAKKFHHVIEVVRLDKSETWFGSHSKLYDSLDTNSVQKGTDSKGNPIMQRAHVHEIGHLLGLGHVDIGKKHCPSSGNTNLGPCYGVADTDKYSVMGQGMELRDRHANPWRRAIIDFTKKGNMTNAADWAPKRKRHYPRTLPEAASNAHITVKPKRK